MDRMCLTDAQWARMQPQCRGKVTDPGRTGGDGRLFLEAVLWSEGLRAIGPSTGPNADRQSVARLAAGLRELEFSVQTLPRLGESRCFQTDFRRCVG